MKNKLITASIVGALAVGAVGGATLTPSAQSATIEKIDSKNITTAIPVPMNIDKLKKKLVDYEDAQARRITQCQSDQVDGQKRIDETKDIITKAKTLGVE